MKIEKINLQNISVAKLLNSELVKELKAMGLNPVSLVFMPEKPGAPLIISHETLQEVNEENLHIVCPEEAVLKKTQELLKKFGAK